MAKWPEWLRFGSWRKESRQTWQQPENLPEEPKEPPKVSDEILQKRAEVQKLLEAGDPIAEVARYVGLPALTDQDCRRLSRLINKVRFHGGWLKEEILALQQFMGPQEAGEANAGTPLRECLQGILHVYDAALGVLRTRQEDTDFASDLAVSLRLHGCGVSVINAQGDSRYPSAASAKRPCRFTWESNNCTYEVEVQEHPTIVDASIVRSRWLDLERVQAGFPGSEKFTPHELDTVYLLHEGESVTVGRPVGLKKYFRHPVEIHRPAGFPLQDKANTGNIPRCGIRIGRKGGHIEIRDLGSSKSSFTEFYDDKGRRWRSKYDPDEVPEEDDFTQGVCDIYCLDDEERRPLPSLFDRPTS